MTISMMWEPVLDAASDSGSSGGSRGRGGRRSSSIIAGRRPSRRSGETDAEDSAANEGSDDSEEDRPKTPRRRRRTTATRKDEAAADTASDDEEKKPRTPRRRRRTTTASKASAEDAKTDDEEAAATSRRGRSGGAADAGADDATAESETAEPVAEAPEDEPTAEAPEADAGATALPSTTRRAGSSNGAADGEVAELRALVAEQSQILNEVRAGLLTLGGQLDRAAQKPRLGVFVDVPNLMYGQGPDEKPVNMGRLLEFLRQGRDIVRATAYSPVSDNPSEPLEQQKFVAPFVPYEYRIVTKPLKRFADGSIKGNFDVEMAIDMLTMADRLDIIAIVSGDADFARAVEVVQTRGVRVEVVAFAQSSSLEMRSLADRYVELGAVIDQIV